MSNDAILNILHRVYVKGVESGNPNYNKVVEEAAQQIRQYVLDEIIGEDDKPLEYPIGKITDINGEQKQLIRQRSFDGDDARNKLRAEQKRRLNGKKENK